MPSVLVTTREGWIGPPQAVFEAVDAALAESIGSPPSAIRTRLVELPASHLRPSVGCGDRFVEIQVAMKAGRDAAKKAALIKAAHQRFAALGAPDADIKVVIIEQPDENWG